MATPGSPPDTAHMNLKPFAVLAAIVVAAFAAASTVGALLIKALRPSFGDPADDSFDLTTAMTGREFTSTAKAFDGGRATTWAGGTEIDLRGATLGPDGADIEVLIVFGGMDMRVPAGWNVDLDVQSFCGGADAPADKPGLASDVPTLRIWGNIYFGGLSVRAGDAT